MNDNFAPPSGEPIQPTESESPAEQSEGALPEESLANPTGAPVPVDVPPPPSGEAVLSSDVLPPPSGEAIPSIDVSPPTSGEDVSSSDVPPPSGEPIPPTESTPASTNDDGAPTASLNSAEPAAPAGAPVAGSSFAPAPAPASSSGTTAAMPVGGAQASAFDTPGGVNAPAPTPVAGMSAPAAQAPKKNRKPLIIALAAVGVIIIAVIAFFGIQEMNRSNAYNTADMHFSNGEYALARDGFSELGDYRDAMDRARIADDYDVYEQGKALYEEGAYADARTKFASIISSGISEVSEWIQRCDYALADELYVAGDLEGALEGFKALGSYEDAEERIDAIEYELADKMLAEGAVEEAYEAFLALGSYSDAAARAAAIPQAFPASGVLWQAEGSHYQYAAIEIDYKYSSGGAFYKIYSGETLMAMLFCNANSTVRVYLNPGNYTIKEGTGDNWFGTDLAFGKKGYYSTMTYDDSGTDWFTLGDGDLVTITINSGSAGNVSERDEDLSTF